MSSHDQILYSNQSINKTQKRRSGRTALRLTFPSFQQLISLTTLLSLFASCICVSALPIDYEYQLDNPTEQSPQVSLDDLQQSSSLIDEENVKLSSEKCRVECEAKSAGECLHCLRYIDARSLAPSKQKDDDQSPVNQFMVGPLLWTSTLRYPTRMSPYAQQLLMRLHEAQQIQRSAPNTRAHKKDLRMALQRRLNAQDVNSLLRNNWVG